MVARFFASLALILFNISPANSNPLDQALQEAFADGKLPGLHGTIAELGSQRLTEVYFVGQDQRWGRPLGEVSHGPEILHDIRSVTKSVVGLLYGIALKDGLVPPPDASLYAQFPEYPDLLSDPNRDAIKVQHALTMQMGLSWNEDLPYSDPRNSEIAMEHAEDRIRFALEQAIAEAPGQSWNYSGGAVAVLGALIERGSGKPLDAYAKEVLFDPLGITNLEWVAGADGVPSAASGLRLTLPDLVKFGHLVAQNGKFEGQEIVPTEWLDQSFKTRVSVNKNTNYGYLWYLFGEEDNKIVIAVGNGGQRLTVQPKYGLVTATFAGRYNDPNSWQTSFSVLIDYVVPEARRRSGK